MSKRIQQQKVYSDYKLKLKYDILCKLGQGCFGAIYKAINRSTKQQIALKIQMIKQDGDGYVRKSSLTNQIFILNKLKGVHGVPQVIAAGKWSFGYYMEIELYSSSLYQQRKKQFSQTEIHVIITQLIKILKNIHQKNVIHQDLKPQNIMRNKEGSFVIIDFGLSSVFQPQNQNKAKRGFVGTPRYASISAHKGQIQKPKDDIQSLLYVIGSIYLKKAPWFQLKGSVQNRLQKIQIIKSKYCVNWFNQCGPAFLNAYQYLINLEQNSALDYNHLCSVFQASRRSYIVKTLKFQSPTAKTNRRKSGTDAEKFFMAVPTINLHLIENKSHKRQKSNSIIYSKSENGEQISRSQNSYSLMAQDGLKQVFEVLTQTFMANFQDEQEQNSHKQDATHLNSITSEQPSIHNVSKLYAINFKNPFQI